jgi:hypothetical protein
MNPYALQHMVKRDHNIDVPLGQCWKAKKMTSKAIFSSYS